MAKIIVFVSQNKQQVKDLYNKLIVNKLIKQHHIRLKLDEDMEEFAIIETKEKNHLLTLAAGAGICVDENYDEMRFLNIDQTQMLKVLDFVESINGKNENI